MTKIQYGARVAAKSDITEEDAKVVLKSFKQAAGMFESVKGQSSKSFSSSLIGRVAIGQPQIWLVFCQKFALSDVIEAPE